MRRSGRQSVDLVREAVSSPKLRKLRRGKWSECRTIPNLTETRTSSVLGGIWQREGETTVLRGGNSRLSLCFHQLCFSEENSSMADNPSSEHQLSNESLREKIREIPNHITESQKLLKTSIFQMPEPEFPTKCLILNIYKIKQPQYEVCLRF